MPFCEKKQAFFGAVHIAWARPPCGLPCRPRAALRAEFSLISLALCGLFDFAKLLRLVAAEEKTSVKQKE
jgi:hypothetical protein